MRIPGQIAFVFAALGASAPGADDAFFTQKVEPVLKRRCYECHSHETGKMKGGLTLDSRSGWANGGDSGAAIVPGKLEESLLVKMVRWSDEEHRMPPKERLPAEEVAFLETWVAQGAADPRSVRPAAKARDDWWSLRPLVRPAVPASGHPIDAFVRAEISRAGLEPSAPADRRTLVRRLFFDLHGLPPSHEEVESFVASNDATAYDALVDRLLASPRYGERWARHWMDAIHFADSHGFEHDVFRPNAWRYRDYIISALNRDTAWDRFVREQLAADVLFPADSSLVAALGFLGAGNYDTSAAGTAPKNFEYVDRDDLVTQTMAAFVSTTANCARCHAHKFDPITQEDYFALQAVFAGIGKGDIPFDADVATAERRQKWSALRDAANRGDATILLSAENTEAVALWERERAAAPAWTPLKPEVFVSSDGASLMRLEDDSVVSSGARPDKDTYTTTLILQSGKLASLRLDLLPHDSLPMKGPGRQDNGNLHITEIEAQLFAPGVATSTRLTFRRGTSDFDQVGYGVATTLDGDAKTSWAIHPEVGRAHHGVFELAVPVQAEAGARLVIALKQSHGGGHLIGRFRFSANSAGGTALIAISSDVEAALQTAPEARSQAQRVAIAAAVLRARATDELAALPPQARVWAAGKIAINERGTVTISEPRTINVLKRGDLDKPGAEAAPGALSAVSEIPARFALADGKNEGLRRAALADWVADARNPLTWRSVVNRVWHHHFGKGMCDTPSDFGRMGGTPSHPELMDWLAAWFRDDAKGSLKALHRLIVTSETYRQSSANRSAAFALDPENRLLWRMNRMRLDADTIRDSILAVSGTLDLAIGGPGSQHFKTSPGPQSTPIVDYTAFDWDSPGATRRSIYRVVWRGIADPFMEAVDFPDMGMLSPVRGFSASPLQSLALFNNNIVLHHSAKFAERVGKSADPVRAMFHHAFQREPTADESAAFAALAEKHSLAAVCRVILNSNEFLFAD